MKFLPPLLIVLAGCTGSQPTNSDGTNPSHSSPTLPKLSLGQSVTIVDAEITPLLVERRPIEWMNLGTRGLSEKPVLVLSYRKKNISEGAVFSSNCSAIAVDNFGNKCEPIAASSYVAANFVDGFDALQPGDERIVWVAVVPKIDTAIEYRWTITSEVTNGDNWSRQWIITTGVSDIESTDDVLIGPRSESDFGEVKQTALKHAAELADKFHHRVDDIVGEMNATALKIVEFNADPEFANQVAQMKDLKNKLAVEHKNDLRKWGNELKVGTETAFDEAEATAGIPLPNMREQVMEMLDRAFESEIKRLDRFIEETPDID